MQNQSNFINYNQQQVFKPFVPYFKTVKWSRDLTSVSDQAAVVRRECRLRMDSRLYMQPGGAGAGAGAGAGGGCSAEVIQPVTQTADQSRASTSPHSTATSTDGTV